MLFFTISGFLITFLALKELRRTRTFDLKNFYIRRSLRIFPLYYAVLSLVCFLIYVLRVYPIDVRNEFTERLPSYLFYYSNLTGPIHGPYSLLWSLAVEEQFYLFFAIIFYTLPFMWTRLIFFSLTTLRLIMPIWGAFFEGDHLLLMALRYQEAILLGVSLAYLFENPTFFQWFRKWFGQIESLCILLISLLICFFCFSIEKDPWLETTINILFMLTVGAAAVAPPVFLLATPTFLPYIGKISYGIYLIHTIIFYGIKKYISDASWAVFTLGTPATILLATISYNHFEKYFIDIKKRFNPS